MTTKKFIGSGEDVVLSEEGPIMPDWEEVESWDDVPEELETTNEEQMQC